MPRPVATPEHRRMDTLQGRITRVRHTVEVTGNSARTSTWHVAIFEIGDVL